MRLFVADLPRLAASPATLLLEAGMAAPDLPLALWRAVPRGDDVWLVPEAGDAAEATQGMPLTAAPSGVLAVLAVAVPAWLAAWPDAAPPVLRPDALAGFLAARMLEEQRRAAELRAALVTLRAEHEDARTAMEHWLRAAGQHWPQPARMVHADTPGSALPLAAGRTRLRHITPTELPDLSAIGLHLSQAECGPGTLLRLRLLGEESGRIAGAWSVPGEALRPGWLALDLPMPAQPWRETATIEIAVDRAADDRLAFSAGPDGGPAVRLFRSPGAARFVAAAHWQGAAHGLLLPPAGVRLGLPGHVWQGVPRHLVLAPGEVREVLLPAVPVQGLDTLHARLRLVGGTAMQAALSCAGGATGWREFDAQGGLEISLELPLAVAVLPLTLSLRQIGPLGCGVEWLGLVGSRATA